MFQEWSRYLALVPIILMVISIIIIFFKTGKKEVEPGEALVYKNQWSGKARSVGAGTYILKPGIEKSLREKVSLRNEPWSPDMVTITLADGNEINIKYEITTQKVVDPVKAATIINYDKRSDLVVARIKTYFLDAFVGVSGKDLVTENGNGKGGIIKKRNENFIKDTLENVEKQINERLKKEVEENWGVEVIIGMERFDLPGKLTEVVGEASTAEYEGKKIKKKAKSAGVSPNLAFILDAISDIVEMWKGGSKK